MRLFSPSKKQRRTSLSHLPGVDGQNHHLPTPVPFDASGAIGDVVAVLLLRRRSRNDDDGADQAAARADEHVAVETLDAVSDAAPPLLPGRAGAAPRRGGTAVSPGLQVARPPRRAAVAAVPAAPVRPLAAQPRSALAAALAGAGGGGALDRLAPEVDLSV